MDKRCTPQLLEAFCGNFNQSASSTTEQKRPDQNSTEQNRTEWDTTEQHKAEQKRTGHNKTGQSTMEWDSTTLKPKPKHPNQNKHGQKDARHNC